MKREEIIRDLVERSSGAGAGQYISIRCDVAREIVAMLKEQEARVMTLEEVRECDDWMWVEYQSGYCGWQKPTVDGYDEEGILWDDATFDPYDVYGDCWRCWTSRPSPEQMRDTKWEDDNETM